MKSGEIAIVGANIAFSLFPNAIIGIIFKGTAVKITKTDSLNI